MTIDFSSSPCRKTLFAALAFSLLAFGCATGPRIPEPLSLPLRHPVSTGDIERAADAEVPRNVQGAARDAVVAPSVPVTMPNKVLKPKDIAPAPADPLPGEVAELSLNFEQLPLPTFIQVVFGEVLKKTVNIDNVLMSRKDLVTLRTGAAQTPSQVMSAAQMLLKSYGISVIEFGSLIRVVPDTASTGSLPEIRRGAALPDTPLPMRPVFHLVDLQAVRNADIANWIKSLFGKRIELQEDGTRNALLISGTSDNVRAALEAVAILDQPNMRGRQAVMITPSFWGVDELAKRLTDILIAEGYTMPAVTAQLASGGTRYPIILLPVASVNLLLAFTQSDQVAQHIQEWVRTLDQPKEQAQGRGFFTYTARNVSAESLARTVGQLLGQNMLGQGGAGEDAKAPVRPVVTGKVPGQDESKSAPKAAAGKSSAATGVVVDNATNTLIFRVAAEEYPHIQSMLKVLDRPAREALIEVTVAEVSLGADSQFGMEWKMLGSPAGSWSAGTQGGLSLGTGGFTYQRTLDGGDRSLVLNALASDNRASILSSPRVMARNGESATIQVGQEVPIITSQQSGVTGTAAGILQTVQYRSTGVILRVRPVIHAGDQIDLEVAQEVSAAQSTNTGVNISPTISTRKVETKLSLKHGSTVMLAGLISTTESDGDAGIPWLKDIPLLGVLFGKKALKKDKTELIVLITPYIINDDHDAQAITQAFRERIGGWASPRDVLKDNAFRTEGLRQGGASQ